MKTPDLKLLHSFIELAQDGSFTKAAERLHMTQPTLSLQIRRLEDSLGFALFLRSTRSVQLTPEGSQLLVRARRLVEEERNLEDAVRRLQFGGARKLHVGAATYTAHFAQRNAVIDRFIVEQADTPLVIHTASQNELIGAVSRLELDLAFVIGMAVSRPQYEALAGGRRPGEGIYPEDMRMVTLGQRMVELLIPTESPLARMTAIPPSALRGQTVAMVACAEGRPLLEPIVSMLEDAGAFIVFPPEAHVQASVERYGYVKRVPAVTLGWDPEPTPLVKQRMVRRPFAGHAFHTELVLLAAPENDKPAVESLIRIAEQTAIGDCGARAA